MRIYTLTALVIAAYLACATWAQAEAENLPRFQETLSGWARTPLVVAFKGEATYTKTDEFASKLVVSPEKTRFTGEYDMTCGSKFWIDLAPLVSRLNDVDHPFLAETTSLSYNGNWGLRKVASRGALGTPVREVRQAFILPDAPEIVSTVSYPLGLEINPLTLRIFDRFSLLDVVKGTTGLLVELKAENPQDAPARSLINLIVRQTPESQIYEKLTFDRNQNNSLLQREIHFLGTPDGTDGDRLLLKASNFVNVGTDVPLMPKEVEYIKIRSGKVFEQISSKFTELAAVTEMNRAKISPGIEKGYFVVDKRVGFSFYAGDTPANLTKKLKEALEVKPQ